MKAVKSTFYIRASPIHAEIANLNVRFLADRFVEGICPHCGADVLPPLSYLVLLLTSYSLRMPEVTNATCAPGRWMLLN